MHLRAVCLVVLSACVPPSKGTETIEPPIAEPTEGVMKSSARANVRFKRHDRLAADYSAALGIDRDELCREFATNDCASDVHRVALGGVDPYQTGLYEASNTTGASTPLIVERIALAACGERVDRDFSTATGGVIFKGLTVGADGKLALDAKADAAVVTLYQRTLLRSPTDAERAAVIALYTELESSGAPEPARLWARLACMTVLTLSEALFY